MQFGLFTFPTHETIRPAEQAAAIAELYAGVSELLAAVARGDLGVAAQRTVLREAKNRELTATARIQRLLSTLPLTRMTDDAEPATVGAAVAGPDNAPCCPPKPESRVLTTGGTNVRDALARNVKHRFDSYVEVLASFDDEALSLRLNVPKHRTVAEHLWHRELACRHARSIEAGSRQEWQSLEFPWTTANFAAQLDATATAAARAIDGVTEWTATRDELLLELAEHETMHEAQIIRHIAGAERPMPKSLTWAVCD
jgi:hypothetical protein